MLDHLEFEGYFKLLTAITSVSFFFITKYHRRSRIVLTHLCTQINTMLVLIYVCIVRSFLFDLETGDRLKNIIFKFNYFGSLSQAEFELKIQMLEAWFYFSTSDLRKNIDFIVNMDILFDFPILVYKIFVRIEKSFSCINTLLL